ncbi:uncharacterized WD repeat-containing protein C2A9.03-like isoform X2 [Sesamum indicum]|uniref:Uncharacterized WD repeat-containing protein C2A9.03-like isoform X2 n=1 Tax=Sesamum indicum TaxID=4182 RepID=A0A6I9UTY3_SESIN|nr:uncharacterized WD repeat-containing protein C2A9.03-like isoform X2 [Sesamum indicum]
MEQFPNHELEYVVDDYLDVTDFEDQDVSPGSGRGSVDDDELDSDFEDDFELSKPDSDTSAVEAKNGKDIQGIPWERLNFTREKYRETRLKLYKNYESLSQSRKDLDKCKDVEKGHNFYHFQFNTRLVKSTIVHFQFSTSSVSYGIPNAIKCQLCCAIEAGLQFYLSSWRNKDTFHMLRNLLWATSKHDVYLMQNYSVMHWSSLLRRGKEVLNVAKPITPTLKHPGCLAQTLSRVQISTMTVKDNLMVAGGFQGEVICKYLNQPGVAFCTKLATHENAITNSVDIYNPSGSIRVIAANNDAQVRIFDAENFACLSHFAFPWSVNNTSLSPDGKFLAVLGDSAECLIADPQSGKVCSSLKGHLDYSFASAWHPDGQILATGNQDTTCRLWDIRNLSESLAVLKGRMGAIRAIKFTSDGRFMAMAEPADFIHVFDTQSDYATGQEIDLFGEIAGISFSPDSEALFVGVSDRTYGSLLEFNRRRFDHYLDCIF